MKDFFNQLFPFYIKIDKDHVITGIGRSMSKIQQNQIGTEFQKVYDIVRPHLANQSILDPNLFDQLVIIKSIENPNIILRGQIFVTQNDFYFLGSPWVTNPDDLIKMGLYNYDFAIHDQTSDLLLAIKQQEIQNSDIQELVNTLEHEKIKAEEASESKEFFLANMSHEIRTPMNAILGFSKLLDKSDLSQDQKKHLEIIQSSSQNLLVIINDILDFSKIRAKKLEVRNEKINLLNILKNQYETFKIKTDDKGLDFELKIKDPSLLPQIVFSDEVRLNQVITNVLSNAIKFTEKGKVTLDVEVQDLQKDSCKVKIAVFDTGVGIASDKIDFVFQSFNQVDGNLNKKYIGTGLGLAISKSLVSLLGGDMKLESQEGEGSVFYFTLPFVIDNTVTEVEDNDNELISRLDNIKILLAEDNIYNQELATILLESHGATVVTANNGQEAVNKAKKEDFDIILMDIQMPVMDGIEALNELKKLNLDCNVIALTANAIKGDKEKFIAYGFNSYLSKPFETQDLLKIIGTNSKKSNPVKKMKLYNLESLSNICNGDKKFIHTMIKKFIDYEPDLINELQTSLNELNSKNVKQIVHKMKSSYASLKVDSVLDEINFIESTINEIVNNDIIDAGNRIIDISNELKKELFIYLAE